MNEEKFGEMWFAHKSEMKETENLTLQLKKKMGPIEDIQRRIQAVRNEVSGRWPKLQSLYPKSEELEHQVRINQTMYI